MNITLLDNSGYLRLFVSCVLIAAYSGQVTSEERREELGKLFTDSAQREKLEAVRYDAYDREAESASTITSVTVNGIVLRGDGKSVVWLNGKNTLEGQPGEGVTVDPNAADHNNYSVPVKVDGRLLRMKPGQTWSDGSGTVRDNY